MDLDIKKLTPQERYELVDKFTEKIKLKKYSYQTDKIYISVVKRFLKSGKIPGEFLFSYSNISRSTILYISKFLFIKNKLTEPAGGTFLAGGF